jgi:RNA polymerase sigma-70 factor (ECF subfamily)
VIGVGVVDPFETADAALASELAALYERGHAAWPDVARVAPARFAAELSRRLGQLQPAVVASLHADVYVAIAAADGEAAAARACDEIVDREVAFAATRLRATPTQADDVRSELRRVLFTGDDDRPPALRAFTGRGDLRGYARVIAARALARRMQRDRREETLDSGVLELLDPALDPEVAVLREHYREAVETAFAAALEALTARERAVLRFHLVDGWTIDQLGARYGAHRSTASRWLSAARDKLRAGIRMRLAVQLVIPESQVDSIVALVTSRIEVSLDRLLS